MKGRGLFLLQKVMEVSSNEPEKSNTAMQLQLNSTTTSTITKVPEEVPVNTTLEFQKQLTALESLPASDQVNQSNCISSESSDNDGFDDSDGDPLFKPSSKAKRGRTPVIVSTKRSRSSSSTSSSSNSSSSSSNSSTSSSSKCTEVGNNIIPSAVSDSATSQPTKVDQSSDTENRQKGRKRIRNPANWSSNIKKLRRNTGKSYISSVNKTVSERVVKSPCQDKCKLKCKTKINETSRKSLFEGFWQLGDLQRQREFIVRHTEVIKPKYRYSSTQNYRSLNSAFFFEIEGNRIRVCKHFFRATLNISDQCIRTALVKRQENGFIADDGRGKHGQHSTIDIEIKKSVVAFINSIPRIESHYLRAQTTREFIPGDKSLADLYRDYKDLRQNERLPLASLSTFNRIFNTQFNISFHIPKKDTCDFCETYKNATDEEKQKLSEAYDQHLKEKVLSRSEKEFDKKRKDAVVRVYDLQAVMQVPKGQVSLFFYKSRINFLNFTISDLYAKDVTCFFWDEIEGKRGAVEIGSCVLQYLQMLVEKNASDIGLDIIFYSDNCCGQQKNKYLLSVYALAVATMRINSITHKYLIRGHSQNEGDNVHSVIEKQIKRYTKSGPIYCPQQYATLIRTAKKTGKPYHVEELTHDKFYDLKALQEEWGNNFTVNVDREQIKWHDIKQLRVEKQQPMVFFYKNSYEETAFKKAFVRNQRRIQVHKFSPLKQIYLQKIPLGANKKRDMTELIVKKIIPHNYVDSYYKRALGVE